MILGYSGLHDSESFKRRRFPDMHARFTRVCQGYDSAASLISGDVIYAAVAEERFTRKKATGQFPVNSIQHCLSTAGIDIQDVEQVAHCFHYEAYEDRFQEDELSRMRFNDVYCRKRQLDLLSVHFPSVSDWDAKLLNVPHHIAHAASAFYPSGFSEALIIVADGMGEHQSLTVATGRDTDIEIVTQIPSINSLGILYSVFTMYLGFEFNMDEYKVMGLAPYGNAKKYYKEVMSLITLHEDGSHTIPLLFRNENDFERETYGGSLRVLAETFGPVRTPESEITQIHKDIAASLQAALQTSMLHLLTIWQEKTGIDNLVMAGGVALNCSNNGVIKRSGLFDDMFVQPAAGDDGTSYGAALYAQAKQSIKSVSSYKKMDMPFLGPDVSEQDIQEALKSYPELSAEKLEDDELACAVAQSLLKGEIVAVCAGRMEFGPRALGARSIIADPRVIGMREKINSLVKKREDFRPFAPAVLTEYAAEYFEVEEGDTSLFEYMLCVTHVKPEYRAKLPAITHIDGSARVQTVSKDDNPRFWNLLMAFKEAGGIPMTVNTSFNVRGQPVVCNAREAIETFKDANLDKLVLGNYLIA